MIMPVEVPLPPLDAASRRRFDARAPSDGRCRCAAGASAPIRDALLRTAFDAIQRRLGGTFAEWEGWDWISDFGDPVAEHHAVREAVGIWDESPLQKWLFNGPGRAGGGRLLLHQRHGRRSRSARCATAPFCDEHGKMLGDGVGLPRRRRRRRAGGDGAADRRRPLPAVTRGTSTWRSSERDRADAAPAGAGAALAGAARRARPTPTSPACATSASSREPVHGGRRRGLPGSRARATPASSATRCSARPRAPSGCGRRCSTRARRSASARTAWPRSSRCASRPA